VIHRILSFTTTYEGTGFRPSLRQVRWMLRTENTQTEKGCTTRQESQGDTN
jgi:hypothetical protein